jgi:DNA-directed RNA polymerase specialized sigma24 family protein
MQQTSDTELLRQYADSNSEPAFTALVTRHLNLVYSAAVRKTGNPHAAEEIAQAVFIILAQKAKTWRKETILSGWLYEATRLLAANFLRGEMRRSRREQEAYMQSLSNEKDLWRQVEPLLEDAMGRLN